MDAIQAIEFFRKPPSDKSEVYRIWMEVQLGEVAGRNQIMAGLAEWVRRNNCMQINNEIQTIQWRLPNGSRFVSSCVAFIQWFFCGLEKIDPFIPAGSVAPVEGGMEDDYDPSEYNRMIVDLDRFLEEDRDGDVYMDGGHSYLHGYEVYHPE